MVFSRYCCLQFQLVYGLNCTKNVFKTVLNHLLLAISHSLSLSLLITLSFVRSFTSHSYSIRSLVCVLCSNQYFTVHAYIQISMLKNLWALLHICTIYSYSCTLKEHTYCNSLLFVCSISKHTYTHTHFICSFVSFRFDVYIPTLDRINFILLLHMRKIKQNKIQVKKNWRRRMKHKVECVLLSNGKADTQVRTQSFSLKMIHLGRNEW